MANYKHNIILGLDTRQFKSSLDKATASLNRMQTVFATVIAGQGVLAFAKLGAQVGNVTKAFDNLGDPAMINDLRAATKGMVNDLELMKAAVQANNFRIPLENLGKYLQFAAIRAAQTGQSIDYLVNSIMDAVSRGSIEKWDNMGIALDRVRKKLNGVSIETISVGDRAKLMTELVTEELTAMGDTSIDRTQQLITTFENLRNELSKNLLPVINTIFGKFNAGMVQMSYFQDNLKALVGAYSSMTDEGMIALARAKDYEFPGLQQAIDDYISATRQGKGIGDAASMQFITSMREILGQEFDMKAHIKLVESILNTYYGTAKAAKAVTTGVTAMNSALNEDGFNEAAHAARVAKNAAEAYAQTISGIDAFKPTDGFTLADLDLMEEELLRVEEKLEAIPKKFEPFTKELQYIGNILQDVFMTALNSGEDFFTQMGKWIENFIKRMAVAAATAALLNAISGGSLTFIAGFTQLIGLSKMAHGGIVDKPTPLVAGENGPEAIIPLHKLNTMGGGTLTTRISGRDLLILLEREQSVKNRMYG